MVTIHTPTHPIIFDSFLVLTIPLPLTPYNAAVTFFSECFSFQSSPCQSCNAAVLVRFTLLIPHSKTVSSTITLSTALLWFICYIYFIMWFCFIFLYFVRIVWFSIWNLRVWFYGERRIRNLDEFLRLIRDWIRDIVIWFVILFYFLFLWYLIPLVLIFVFVFCWDCSGFSVCDIVLALDLEFWFIIWLMILLWVRFGDSFNGKLYESFNYRILH